MKGFHVFRFLCSLRHLPCILVFQVQLKLTHNLFVNSNSLACCETRWNLICVQFLKLPFRKFDHVRLLNYSISQVQLCSIGKSLGWARLCSITEPIKVNRTIGVRLGSISERSIDFASISIHRYSIIVEYDIKGKYPDQYSNVDKGGSEKPLARKSCFV